jgi:hypothetical protein
VALLHRIREGVAIKTRRPAILAVIVRGFPQTLQANVGAVPQARLLLFSSISFPVHSSPTNLPLDDILVYSLKQPKASLKEKQD